MKETLPNERDRALYALSARSEAILGSGPRSHSGLKSAVKLWMDFAANVLGRRGKEFPPMLDGLLAWSHTFRCGKTFKNYLGHIRTMTIWLGYSDDVFSQTALKRAKVLP